MGLRTEIQADLIAHFKVDTFEIVGYTDGIPAVTGSNETPSVICNETSAIISVDTQENKYTLDKWVFDVILTFVHEVDYSDFIFGLSNMTKAYENESRLAMIALSGNILVAHPVQQGGHNGTELRFSVNVDIKK